MKMMRQEIMELPVGRHEESYTVEGLEFTERWHIFSDGRAEILIECPEYYWSTVAEVMWTLEMVNEFKAYVSYGAGGNHHGDRTPILKAKALAILRADQIARQFEMLRDRKHPRERSRR